MIRPQYSVYLGAEKENGFSGFIADDHHFVVVEIEEGFTQAQGHTLIALLKHKLQARHIIDIAHLEKMVESVLLEVDSPVLSLAMGVVKDKILYLKTIGDGQVYISRGHGFAKIIEGDKSASGYLQESDTYIFTTYHFVSLFADTTGLKRLCEEKTPQQIIEEITPSLKSGNDQSAAALFVCFAAEEAEEDDIAATITEQTSDPVVKTEEEPEYVVLKKDSPVRKPGFIARAREQLRTSQLAGGGSKRKLITGVVVTVIFLILAWSVGLGYVRRNAEAKGKQIDSAKELITQKLNQADDVSFLNMARAMILLSEAKDELAKLKKEVGSANDPRIAQLETLIHEKESMISKKEDKNAQEFYDLAVVEKNAQGVVLSLDGSNLAVLDSRAGAIYVISLDKKSVDTRSAAEIKSATRIVNDKDNVYAYVPGKGIYRVDAEGKSKKVIDNDSDWGTITSMAVYNGNLYILDTRRSTVYKYIGTEDGFSTKGSYFKSDPGLKLSDTNTLAIDSSVYIGLSSHIMKFTAGEQDGFQTAFPVDSVDIARAYTNADLEKVYAWDRTNASMFILSKDGEYEKQIKSPAFGKADDIIVYGGAAYVLMKQKLYKLDMN